MMLGNIKQMKWIKNLMKGIVDFTGGLRKMKKEKSLEDRHCDHWKYKTNGMDQENVPYLICNIKRI